MMAESIEQYRNQIALARSEIKNLKQQLCSLKYEHMKEIKSIKNVLNNLRCSNCSQRDSIVVPNINLLDSPSPPDPALITYRRIGIIETSFQNKRGVPRQPTVMANAKGIVIIDNGVFNNPEHALMGLEEFSHMWIIFHFHNTESTNVPAKVAPPRLGGERKGVFSTRSPHRPCTIGLSLVQIQGIEGNKIHFNGVDMINGTPVLDVKPFIPQYDYPLSFGDPMSLVRPPTEGISDATNAVAGLQIDENFDTRSISPRLTNPMRVDISPRSRSPFEDDNPSPYQTDVTPLTPSPDSPSPGDMPVTRFPPQSSRPDTERGAPDGQERFTPPQSANVHPPIHDGIRVAPWVNNPPTQPYRVVFTDDVVTRLTELIGDRAQDFKTNIQSLLSEDPRSSYVRTRYADHEYSCVLEDLSISCVFDASSRVCTIMAVRSAEEMQS